MGQGWLLVDPSDGGSAAAVAEAVERLKAQQQPKRRGRGSDHWH